MISPRWAQHQLQEATQHKSTVDHRTLPQHTLLLAGRTLQTKAQAACLNHTRLITPTPASDTANTVHTATARTAEPAKKAVCPLCATSAHAGIRGYNSPGTTNKGTRALHKTSDRDRLLINEKSLLRLCLYFLFILGFFTLNIHRSLHPGFGFRDFLERELIEHESIAPTCLQSRGDPAFAEAS